MQSNYMLSGDPLSLDRIRSVLTRLEDTIIFGLIERAQFAHNPKIYQKGAFGELKKLDFKGSWLEWFLAETEAFHGMLSPTQIHQLGPITPSISSLRLTSKSTEIFQVRTPEVPLGAEACVHHISVDIAPSPDEYPFTSNLPEPVLKPVDFPKILYPNTVNANPSILSFYTRQIVPRITKTATVQLAASKRAKGITGDEEYEDDGNYGSAATLDVEVLQAISKRVHYGTVYL